MAPAHKRLRMDAPDAQAPLPGLQRAGARRAQALLRRVVGGEREDRPATAGPGPWEGKAWAGKSWMDITRDIIHIYIYIYSIYIAVNYGL